MGRTQVLVIQPLEFAAMEFRGVDIRRYAFTDKLLGRIRVEWVGHTPFYGPLQVAGQNRRSAASVESPYSFDNASNISIRQFSRTLGSVV